MKAISLWQAWASLIAIEAKRIETRGWATRYRGPLVIHAAKRPNELKLLEIAIYNLRPSDATELHTYAPGTFNYHAIKCLYAWHGLRPGAMIPKLPLQAALCVVDLVDCIPVEKVGNISDQERAFGNYEPGRFAWILENVRMFDEPVKVAGHQGFWEYKTA